MTKTVLGMLLGTLLLAACSDHRDRASVEASVHFTANDLKVYFPPSEARFLGMHIPVRGRIENITGEVFTIEVDGGAGPVTATLADDGSWIADSVPLDDTPLTTISVTVTGERSAAVDQVVATLHRTAPDQPPSAVAYHARDDSLYVKFGGEGFREYTLAGDEVRRFSVPVDETTSLNQLEFWEATQELVFMSSHSPGGCGIFAYQPGEKSSRLLIQLLWRGKLSFSGPSQCDVAAFTVTGDNLIVIDANRRVILTLDTLGEIVSHAAYEVVAGYGPQGTLLAVPGRPEQVTWVGPNTQSFSSITFALETWDTLSGAQLDLIIGPSLVSHFFYADTAPLAARASDSIYVWLFDQFFSLDLDTGESNPLNTTGFAPANIVSMSQDEAGNVFNLDQWGRLSALEAKSGVSAPITDFAPFIQPPINFSDNITANGEIFMTTEHQRFEGLSRGGTIFRWRNVYQLNPDTLNYQVIYASNSERNTPYHSTSNFFNTDTTQALVQNSDYSIQFQSSAAPTNQLHKFEHRTGLSTPFNTGEITGILRDQTVVDLNGKFLVLNHATGVFEYNIETGQLTRSLVFENAAEMPPLGLVIAARFPGDNGAIYFTNSPFTAVYRIDFDTKEFVLVSGGSNIGEGPIITPQLDASISSWSPEDNAVYFGAPDSKSILRVDLASGNREKVFIARDAAAFEVPDTLRDIRFMHDRNGLLATGGEGVYYLDLATATIVRVPLQPSE